VTIPAGGVRTIIGPNGRQDDVLQPAQRLAAAERRTHLVQGPRDHLAAGLSRARLGIARSFQITNIFGHLTVLRERAARGPSGARRKANFFLPSRRDGDLGGTDRSRAARRRLMEAAAARRRTSRTAISGGSRSAPGHRQRSAGAAARPAAGGNVADRDPRDGRLDPAHLRPGRTILLVEHDIDVVMAISTTITVFQTGQGFATGTPQEIRCQRSRPTRLPGRARLMLLELDTSMRTTTRATCCRTSR